MDKSLGWSGIDLHGNCAQYAIKHAMLLLGIPLTIKQVHSASGLTVKDTVRYGTDEKGIKKAIKYLGLAPLEYETDKAKEILKIIDQLLDMNSPVICCAEGFQHWVLIAGRAKKKYIYIDSADSKPTGLVSESDLTDWLSYDNRDTTYSYYIIGITEKGKKANRHSVVGSFGMIYELLKKDKFLKAFWGYYLKELLLIGNSPKGGGPCVKLYKLILENEKEILSGVALYHGKKALDEASGHLQNLKLISEAHNLYIPHSCELIAIIQTSCLLYMLAGFK